MLKKITQEAIQVAQEDVLLRKTTSASSFRSDSVRRRRCSYQFFSDFFFIPYSVNKGLQFFLAVEKGVCPCRGVNRIYPALKASTQGGGTKRTTDRRYGSSSPHPPAKKRKHTFQK